MSKKEIRNIVNIFTFFGENKGDYKKYKNLKSKNKDLPFFKKIIV